MDSVGQSRMSALHGGRRDKLVVSPNLWAGVGLVRGGAGTALVGSPEEVAARMEEYRAIGIDTFILSGYPHLEEAYRFAELVFPLLPLAHAPERATSPSTPARSARPSPTRSGRRQQRRPEPWRAARSCKTPAPRRSALLLGVADRAARRRGRSPRAAACCRRGCCRRRARWRVAFWESLPRRHARHPRGDQRPAGAEGARSSAAASASCSGVVNGISRPAETLLDSTMQMLRNMPHLAMIPLVILWFGIGESAKIFLVAIGVLSRSTSTPFTASAPSIAGLIEMARVYGLGRCALFWRVILPGALPSILVGLRFSLGIMWLTLIVAETISASSGIGYMTMNAREFLQTDVVLLGILLYALLGKLADVLTRLLERRALAWHPAYHVPASREAKS